MLLGIPYLAGCARYDRNRRIVKIYKVGTVEENTKIGEGKWEERPNIINMYGSNALIIAFQRELRETVEIFIRSDFNIHAKDKFGWDDLMIACSGAHKAANR